MAIKVFGDTSILLKFNSKTRFQRLADHDEDDLEAHFTQEVLIHAQIESPFVLECYGGFWNDEKTIRGIILEFAPRGDMSSFIGKRKMMETQDDEADVPEEDA